MDSGVCEVFEAGLVIKLASSNLYGSMEERDLAWLL